jgi:hypothetical protein
MLKKNISPESHFSFYLIGIITISHLFMENCLTQQQLQRDVLIRLFTARRGCVFRYFIEYCGEHSTSPIISERSIVSISASVLLVALRIASFIAPILKTPIYQGGVNAITP